MTSSPTAETDYLIATSFFTPIPTPSPTAIPTISPSAETDYLIANSFFTAIPITLSPTAETGNLTSTFFPTAEASSQIFTYDGISSFTPTAEITSLNPIPPSPTAESSALAISTSFALTIASASISLVSLTEMFVETTSTPAPMPTNHVCKNSSIYNVSTFSLQNGTLLRPFGMALDLNNSLYVADSQNHVIRKISTDGTVSTYAGIVGVRGNSSNVSRFNSPNSVAVDANGIVYVSDTGNSMIKKISLDGQVSILAGMKVGKKDGIGIAAELNLCSGIAINSKGIIFIADNTNHAIRKLLPNGNLTTLAGNLTHPGSSDGFGAAASFRFPFGIALDSEDNIYVADTDNHLIRKITSLGDVTTIAGSDRTTFYFPFGITVDSNGTVYTADSYNYAIRRISKCGIVSTIAGTPKTRNSTDGVGLQSSFDAPYGILVTPGGDLFVSEFFKNTIRLVTVAK